MSLAAKASESIRVETHIVNELLAHARAEPRIECCGLLAGRDGLISVALPARNGLGSATAYEIAPNELFALFRRMREENLDHLGIYHSHPNTDNAPSRTDIERAYYPGAAYFIVSPRDGVSRPVRAFRIDGGKAEELTIELI